MAIMASGMLMDIPFDAGVSLIIKIEMSIIKYKKKQIICYICRSLELIGKKSWTCYE